MEYTFKGTPGPWSARKSTTTHLIFIETNHDTIAEIDPFDMGVENQAMHNAHLIAAALDLLEACIADVRNIYDGEEHVGYQVDGMNGKALCTFELTEFDHACQYIESLRKAAIKKALNL